MRSATPARFIIVGLQRSGTTVTLQCLKGHPEVSCAAAELRVAPFFTLGASAFTKGDEFYEYRCQSYPILFDAITTVTADEQTRANGLKVALYTEADAVDLVHAVQSYLPDLRVIWVRRSDEVAQCGSLVRAERTGQWHKYGTSDVRKQDVRTEIGPERFARYVATSRGIEAQLARLRATHPVLEFVYERDIHPEFDSAKLFEFAGVSVVEPSWLGMQKLAPPPSDYILDYAARTRQAEREPVVDDAEALRRAEARELEVARAENPIFLADRAWVSFARGDDRAALRDLGVLAEESPWRIRGAPLQTARNRVLLRRYAGECRELARALRELDEQLGDPGSILVQMGRTCQQIGRPDLAAEYFAEALACAELGEQQVAWSFRGLENALEALGDIERAGVVLDELEPLRGAHHYHLYLRGVLALAQQGAEAARPWVDKALAARPDFDRAGALAQRLGS